MTVQTPGLLMAFLAFAVGFSGYEAVSANPVAIVGKRDSRAFVTGVAVLELQGGKILVGGFFGVRLLLENHQGTSQNCNDEK